MKEVKLKNEDYYSIKIKAHKRFISDNVKDSDSFLVQCVLDSAIDYFKYKGYIVKDGKVYSND